MLLAGSVNAAIGYFGRRLSSLDYRQIFEEEQRAYCGREHALFGRAGQVGFAEADSYAWAWAWRNYSMGEQELPHIPPDAMASSESMEAIAVLILSGRYLGYLPRHFAEPYVKSGQLAEVNPVQMRYSAGFHLVARRKPHRSEIVEAFIADLDWVHEENGYKRQG